MLGKMRRVKMKSKGFFSSFALGASLSWLWPRWHLSARRNATKSSWGREDGRRGGMKDVWGRGKLR